MNKKEKAELEATSEDALMGDAVRNMKTRIIKILKDAGIYSPTQSYQAELAAGDLLMYRKLRKEALKAEPYFIETSREGHPRHVINPIFDAVSKASLRVTADFEKLCLNVKDSKIKAQVRTDMDELNDKIQSLLND